MRAKRSNLVLSFLCLSVSLLLCFFLAFAATLTEPYTTASNYTFSDSGKITVAGGVAKLVVQKPFHLHDTKTEYDTGTYADTEFVNEAAQGSSASTIKTSETGLVAYYPFNGTTGAIANLATVGLEDTKSTNEGTASNVNGTGMAFAAGKFGNGVSFNGVDDFVLIPASSVFDVQNHTISTWVYSSNFNQNGFIFEKTTNGAVNTQYSLFFNSSNEIFYRTHNSTGSGHDLGLTLSNAGINNSQWYHIAARYDGTTKKIFVNGVEKASIGYTQTLVTNPVGTSFIGAYGPGDGYRFNGLIDDVAIYNRALTAAEVAAQAAPGARVHMKASASLAPKLAAGYPGLVAYWPLDHASGTVAADLAGANKGTLTNFPVTPTWAAGVNANGLTFDGTDDFVSVSNNAALNPPANLLTLSAWVKTSTASRAILSKGTVGTNGYTLQLDASGYPVFIKEGVTGGTLTATSSVSNNAWHHVAGVASGSGMFLYIDGTQNATNANTGNLIAQTAALTVGKSSAASSNLNGTLDEVAIFNRALAAGEIAYLAGKKGETATYTGPVMDGEITAAAWDKLTMNFAKATPGMNFAGTTIGSTFTAARAVTAGDMDGDGDLDLVAGGTDATTKLIKWYNNAGAGTFTETSISTTVTAMDIAIGDLTGDAANDFIVADNVGGGVKWYKSDGAATPTFTEQTLAQIATDASPTTVAIADVDADGVLDVVAGFSGVVDKIVWYASDGASAPTFTVQTAVVTAFDCQHLLVQDVNGDGSLDIVAASNAGNTVSWFKGNGGTSWTRTDVSIAFTGAQYVGAADMDADGDVDLTAAGNGNNSISWFVNDGSATPTFATKNDLSAVYTAAAAALPIDFDYDGDMDLLTAGAGTGDRLDWWSNNGSQVFTQTAVATGYGDPFDIATGDFTGDGALEFAAVSNTGNTVNTYLNTPWKLGTVDGALDGALDLFPADIDADGDLDLAIASDGTTTDQIAYYKQTAAGVFGVLTNAQTAGTVKSIHVADLNNDGKLDLLAIDSTGLNRWIQGATADTWTKNAAAVDATMTSGQAIGVALDGGRTDILVAGTNKVDWWKQNETTANQYDAQTDIEATFTGAAAVTAADIDNDGDLDVLAGAGSTASEVAWWAQTTAGVFGTKTSIQTAFAATSVAAADLDADGDLDALFTGGNEVAYSLNGGTGFTANSKVSIDTALTGARKAAAADLDGDGDMDIVATGNTADVVAWYENVGSLTFEKRTNLSGAFDGAAGLAVADLDADGLLDVAAVADTADDLAWWQQKSHAKVQFQTRTDAAAAPATAYIGPDGTAKTFYGSGAGIKENVAGSARYGQYKATLYRNDTTLDPMIKDVRLDYRALTYSTANPHVTPATGQAFTYLTSFAETATKPVGSEVKYLLSPDNATTWYYHSGTAWTASDGTYAQASLASAINTNIAGFDDKAYADLKLPENSTGTLKFRAFLNSDGAANPQLDAVNVGYETGSITMTAPNGAETWKVGSTKNITWTGTGVIPSNLTLEYSTDNFITPVSIATGVQSGYGVEKDPATIAGKVGVWRMSEGTGQTVGDTSGSANNGTLGPTTAVETSDPTWSTLGKWGNALSFDGVDDYVIRNSVTPYNQSRSVAFWVKLNTTGAQRGILQAATTATDGGPIWLISQRANNVLSVYHGGDYRDGTTTLTTGVWYHGAYTFDATTNTAKLYLNANQEFSGAVADSNGNNTSLWFGTGSPNYFSGLIDDAAVYNRALTAAEIAELADGGSPSYPWTVPNAVSGTVKVRARSTSVPAIRDASNANFTIADLNITAPNGAEIWKAGTTKQITWTPTAGVPNDLVVEYSTNSGGTWNAITGGTALNATTGTPFNWTVPSTITNTARVRVRSATAADFVDSSNADFTIADLNVTAPNGGEFWKVGTTQNITWGATAYVPNNLNLEYTTNGTTYTSIATLVPAAGNDLGVTGEKDPATITGKVGVWRMNEVSGTTTADTSGSGNTGTLINSPTFVAGKYGNGLDFSSSTSYLSITEITIGSTWSLTGWVKFPLPTTTSGWRTLFQRSGGTYDHILWDSSGTLGSYNSGFFTTNYNTNALSSGWHHIAAVASGGNTTAFYVDGVLVGTAGTVVTQGLSVIGNHSGGTRQVGSVDDAAVYNRALTAGEISQLAARGYAWTVPAAAVSATTKVRVRSASATELVDASDTNMTVYDLKVTAPNTAVSWAAGSTQNITWTHDTIPGTTVKLELSTDGGTTWAATPIATGIAKSAATGCTAPAGGGCYVWSVPADKFTTQARIRVVDELQAVVLDLSDTNFTISGHTINVTKPAAAEALGITTVKKINWNVTGSAAPTGAKLKLEYSADGLANTDPLKVWNLIDTNVAVNSGTGCDVGALGCYDWAVPSAAASNTVVVRVKDDPAWSTLTGGADAVDAVSGVFRVVGTATVIKPNGGEKWTAGAAHTISYQTQGTMPNVKISYSTDNFVTSTVITASTANNGSYTWTPARADAAASMKIRVENAADSAVKDESNAAFSVTGITVTAPDTALRVKAGDPYTITWTQGAVSNVKIEYAEDGTNYTGTVIASTPASGGSYAWTLPLKMMTGLRVKVSDADAVPAANGTDTALTFDTSDASSVIYGRITVLAPNGNEDLASSNPQNVTWTVSPAGTSVVPNVKIFYTTSTFGTETIEVDPLVTKPSHNNPGAGTGKYVWTPTFTSNTVKLRVVDAGDPAVSAGASAPFSGQNQDDSDAFFSVTGISLVAPTGGQTWTVGTPQVIQFGYTGTLTNAKAEYSVDGGANYLLPAAGSLETSINGTTWSAYADSAGNIAVGSNPYYLRWTVPDAISTNVKVRITQVNADGTLPAPPKSATSGALTITGALTNFTAGGAAITASTALQVGDAVTIGWTKTGTITSQKLEYSTDGGATWVATPIATGITGASQSWTVPDAIGTNVKLRVTDTTTRTNGSPAISLTSAAFSLKAKFVFTAPVVTSSWAANRGYTITGTFTGTVSNVKLEYVDVVSAAATVITSSTAAASGSAFTYAWTVPAAILGVGKNVGTDPKKAFKIRVTDATAGRTGNSLGSVDSASFNIIYYKITWEVRDSGTSALLAGMNVTESDLSGTTSWSVINDSLSTAAILNRYYAYDTYTSTWSKTGYTPASSSGWLADQDKTATIFMESEADKNVSYEVVIRDLYDDKNDIYKVKLTLQRRGSLLPNEALYGGGKVQIWDGTTLLTILTKTAAQLDLDTTLAVNNRALGFNFTYGPPTNMDYVSKFYSLKCTITYNSTDYTSTSNISATNALPGKITTINALLGLVGDAPSVNTIFGKFAAQTALMGAAGDASSASSLFGKIAGAKGASDTAKTAADTAAAAAALAQSAADVVKGLVGATSDAAGAASLFGRLGAGGDAKTADSIFGKVAKVFAVMGDATTAESGTLFKEIQTERRALGIKWQMLNRDPMVKTNEEFEIQFRGEPGKAPTVTIYDPKNTSVVSAAAMTEVGTTGVYKYKYKPTIEGDYMAHIKESTSGAFDAYTFNSRKAPAYEAASEAKTAAAEAKSARTAGDAAKTAADTAFVFSQAAATDTDAILSNLSKLAATVGTAPADSPGAMAAHLAGIESTLNALQSQMSTLYKGGSATTNDAVLAAVREVGAQISRMMATEKPNINLESIYKSVDTTKSTATQMKNMVAATQVAAETTSQLLREQREQPIMKTWYETGSVILKLLVVNPSQEREQIYPLKAYLPKEARPEIIEQIDSELTIEYDPENGSYYVAGEIKLTPGETRVIEIEMTDVWVVEESKLKDLKDQAEKLLAQLKGTLYESRAEGLYANVHVLLTQVFETQNDQSLTPEEHINAYRENMKKVRDVELDLIAMRRFVVEATGKELDLRAGGDVLKGVSSNWDTEGAVDGAPSLRATWRLIFGITGFIGLVGFVSFGIWQRELQKLLKKDTLSDDGEAAPSPLQQPEDAGTAPLHPAPSTVHRTPPPT